MTTRHDIYNLLTNKIPEFTEYEKIPVVECGEESVKVHPNPNLILKPINGKEIYVRKSVAEKLYKASQSLAETSTSLKLELVYGLRSQEVQQNLFHEMKEKLSARYSDLDLLHETHKYIAHPKVAGHPTGGAVDIQIRGLDFGSLIWEFTDDCLTFSPFISKEAWKNRQLLRQLMSSVGFAPYDGEWWHFSYGDKEWAHYYRRPNAIYGALNEV